MFELASGRVPFAAEGRAAAIKAGMEGQAPDLAHCLFEGKQLINAGLGKMIAQALERKPENR